MSKKRQPHYVYFLRPVGALGPVKIGCSRWPAERIGVYLTWSPVPLEIAACIAGGHHIERVFHERFAHLWSHHEWFREAPELEETIQAIRAGTFDIAALPDRRGIASTVVGCDWPEWLQRSYKLASLLRNARKRGDTFIPQSIWNASNELFCPDVEARQAAQRVVAEFLEVQ